MPLGLALAVRPLRESVVPCVPAVCRQRITTSHHDVPTQSPVPGLTGAPGGHRVQRTEMPMPTRRWKVLPRTKTGGGGGNLGDHNLGAYNPGGIDLRWRSSGSCDWDAASEDQS